MEFSVCWVNLRSSYSDSNVHSLLDLGITVKKKGRAVIYRYLYGELISAETGFLIGEIKKPARSGPGGG